MDALPSNTSAPDDQQDPEPEVGVDTDEATEDQEDPSEAAKIHELEKRLVVPQTYLLEYQRFQEDRDYVARDCVAAKDDQDTVLTNFILRNQRVLISQIYARDPSISVRPWVRMGAYGPAVFDFAQTQEILLPRLAQEAGLRDTTTGMLQDVQTCGVAWLKVSMQIDAERDPIGARREDDHLDRIARLDTLMAEYQDGEFDDTTAKYRDMVDLTDTVRRYLQDQLLEQIQQNQPAPAVPTPGQPGPGGGPVPAAPGGGLAPPPAPGGAPTLPPAPGAGPVPPGQPPEAPAAPPQDPNDPNVAQLSQLNGQMGQAPDEALRSLLPDVPYFLGFNLDPVQPEDIRFDWDVTRPEDLYNARWMAHRVYMTCDQIKDRWSDWDEQEVAKDCNTGSYNSHATSQQDRNPDDRSDLEVRMLNGRYAVWELWDRELNRRYVWVQGDDEFLVDDVPTVTWRHFFPFIPLIFNRVTGKMIPISDARLQMPHQDEINMKRTHEREAQKAAYPKFVVAKGSITETEKANLEACVPYGVVELERAEEVDKFLKELATSFKFDPKLYDTSKAEREMEYVSGVSKTAAGQTGGSDTATEAAIADQQMGVQSDYRKTVIEQFIGNVYQCMADMAILAFPEANVKALVGPNAVWPALDRQSLWRSMQIEILPGTTGQPDSKKQLDFWSSLQQLAAQFGLMLNGVEVFKQIIRSTGLPLDMNRFLLDPMMVAQAQAQGLPLPGMPAPPNGGGAGPGGGAPPPKPPGQPQPGPGAPPMNQRRAPPTPQQIPNGPEARGGIAGGAPG